MIGEIDTFYGKKGYLVIGIDEAGRGPLCGPVTVAAVSLTSSVPGINDSKKLSSSRREELAALIIRNSFWQVYSVLPAVIDEKNILHATLWGMKRVGARLLSRTQGPHVVLIDGNRITGSFSFEKALIKGDSLSLNIAAASILAKVHRDRIMNRWHLRYPMYRLSDHKGYPTELHYHLLSQYGPSPIHRRSFKLSKQPAPEQLGLFGDI